MSETFVRYQPGQTPAIASATAVVLVDLPDDDDRVEKLRTTIAQRGEAEDVLDVLLSHGLRKLPTFAFADWRGDGFRIVARGPISVRPDGYDALALTAVPWTDGTLRANEVTLHLNDAVVPVANPQQLVGFARASEVKLAAGEWAAAAQQEVVTAAVPGGVEVVAALCPNGHATPAFAPTCRVCGLPVPQQESRTIPRPALGTLTLSTDQSVPLDRGVILGRGPSIPRDYPRGEGSGDADPRLLPVRDPNAFVSVQHLEISLDYWNVMVRDLGSTGGTVLVLPDGTRDKLEPNARRIMPVGSKVILAETVTASFDALAD